ncbi:MAG: TIM barrel protein [Rhodobacteraceae bacterium]|nr:TIM barrel protein [Paracoccaceae bacterium]
MPDRPNCPRYALRLNAFRRPGAGLAGMVAAAAAVGGIDAADLNYPDHLDGHGPAGAARILADHGLALNGLAMRYATAPGFALGALAHPDRTVRQAAIDLTRRGIDAGRAMGARLMTIWPGPDGVDYPFQGDHGRMWDDLVAALAAIAAHDPATDIALEYKPADPRAFALLPDAATTLLAIAAAGAGNLGVTLDYAHARMAGELPARAATLVARHARLLGVHLNDGYGRRDDGLIAGAVSPVETLELFVTLARIGYAGVIYFDTFPDLVGLDPAAEARASLALVGRLRAVAAGLAADPALAAATAAQDAAATSRIVAAALYGAGGR